MSAPLSTRMDRRDAIKWMLTAAASLAVLKREGRAADATGPAASTVGVVDFVDEWISAPYPGHDADRKQIVDGLTWLDAESQKRFSNVFVNLIARQKNAICDDIAYLPNAKPEFRPGAQFFRRFRDLTAGGYYTTPEGMRDIGYTGNVALDKFEIPAEVLQKLGLA